MNNAEKLLSDNAEMLNNYFSIELAFSPNHRHDFLFTFPWKFINLLSIFMRISLEFSRLILLSFISSEISLVSIPCIMNGLQPQLERLPNFVSALLYVNYEDVRTFNRNITCKKNYFFLQILAGILFSRNPHGYREFLRAERGILRRQ